MTRLFGAAVAVVVVTALPAWAQTSPAKKPAEITTPSAQDSGAGIAGKPGNKSGPAVQPPGSGTSTPGTTVNEPQNPETRDQDASKIKGLPGNKSGPAVKPPSNGNSK
ncbi:MAG TPA: hypothetical protein VN681_03610 [Stellaceae bacterium]|nr:hypothetical protein [Stellaceae bacterium]